MLKRICGNCVYWNPNKPEPKICKDCNDRHNFLPRNMECSMCGAAMIYHRYEFLRCPDCGSEFWPFVNGGSTKKFVRDEFEKNLPCERNTQISAEVMHVKSAKAGGSKSRKTGSSKKQKLNKPSTTAIYKDLAK